MINSRDIKELHPTVRRMAEAMIAKCKEAGIDLIVTSTFRDYEQQAALYAQGRTKPGRIVTNAKPGQSFHNHRIAFDVVPVVNGKADWTTHSLWMQIGEIGESVGLEWAYRWESFKEMAHFQYTAGLTLAQLQAGQKIA